VPPALSISQYWDAESVPAYLAGPLASFRDLNPGSDHRVFSETQAEMLIAEHIGRREADAFAACAVPAMQADYFRYCSVLIRGGVYADVDYRCRAPLGTMVDFHGDGGTLFFGRGIHDLNGLATRRIWNGLFGFSRSEHPFLRLAVEIATANIEARIPERIWSVGENVREAIWLTVGPGVFTLMHLIREWGSFDAFISNIAGSAAEPFGELYCEAIGNYQRLVEAFDGVLISPFESLWDWVEDVPQDELPYKETERHWHNFNSSIFR